jgi:predicted dehydrogenase
VAGADTDPENLELFCKRFNVPGYSSYEEMLGKERIDIAAPILPVSVNPDAVVASARAEVKAIFCEKPLCASLEDADRMVEVCRSRGIYFFGGHTYRNMPQLQDARKLIEAGEIGEVQSIDLYDGNGQGGCHSMSVVRMFARDADPDWVVGWVSGNPFSDVEGDAFSEVEGDVGFKRIGGYIRFKNGIECFSHNNTTKGGIEVAGSRGKFAADWLAFHLWKVKAGTTGRFMADYKEVEGLFPNVDERYRDEEGWLTSGKRLIATVQWVVDSLETGVVPRCSGDDLRKSLEICIALRESHRQNHSPVKLPLQDRSLAMYPVRSRWLYKKEVYGRERYIADMAQHKNPCVKGRSP